MRANRISMALWFALIFSLLVVELAEVTHEFTVPIQDVLGDPLAIVVALIFTTIVALVGAIFIGVYLSHRILSPTGFTPFEEEMLRMRADVQQVKREVTELRRQANSDPASASRATDDEEDP